jgi:hypothetical protein
MIGRWAGWISLLAIVLGCATHYAKPQNDTVHLYLRHPSAEQVLLACSVDGFTRRPARRIQGGLWEATVDTSKEFRYFYVVDGRVYLPACRFVEMDDWGGKNCIYVPGM